MKKFDRKISGKVAAVAEKGFFLFISNEYMNALQIPNSLGDQVFQRDSQNETFVTHHEKNQRPR